MRYFFILLIPIFLSADLLYEFNSDKEMALLESFDIESSFIHDTTMTKMKNKMKNNYGVSQYFSVMDDAHIFIPVIKSILNKYDIPSEFLYLAMAESNFKNGAYSRKKASGLWQFMSGTAKVYKLRINKYVDERRDLIKSTESAAKHLSALHKRFGKWYLAAIAYNCGGGRLSKGIRMAGTDNLSVLLTKKHIPKESQNYIRKIIALALTGTDEKFMLQSQYEHLLNRANASSVATVKLSKRESLSSVSNIISIPLKELKKLNSHLKYDFIPPYAKEYDIYIPYVKLSKFKKYYSKNSNKSSYKIHIAVKGDNLYNIAKKYGVYYKVIMNFNRLKNSKLKLKQKLMIPMASFVDKYNKNNT